MKITNDNIAEQFQKLFNDMPDEPFTPRPYKLVFNHSMWERIRKEGLYDFTDEQMKAAKAGNGFICTSNGVELWLTPQFQ